MTNVTNAHCPTGYTWGTHDQGGCRCAPDCARHNEVCSDCAIKHERGVAAVERVGQLEALVRWLLDVGSVSLEGDLGFAYSPPSDSHRNEWECHEMPADLVAAVETLEKGTPDA